MDRLTQANDGMTWYKSDLLLLEPCEMSNAQIVEVLQRLAAYEDTGLTPDYMKVIATTKGGMILKLVTAYSEGRVIQYAPGDTVHDRFGVEWTVNAVEIHKFHDGKLRHLYRCGHPGTDDFCTLYTHEIRQKPEVGV